VSVDVTFNIIDEEGTVNIVVFFVALLIVAEIDERTAEFLLYLTSAINEVDIKSKIRKSTERFQERFSIKSRCRRQTRKAIKVIFFICIVTIIMYRVAFMFVFRWIHIGYPGHLVMVVEETATATATTGGEL
jgi:hypothetical protein